MLQLKVQDRTFFVPESWEEVTVKQFSDLVKFRIELNPARVMSIFTGIEYDWILNAEPQEIEVKLLSVMSFLGEDIDLLALVRKDYISIGGRELKVPKDIRNETYGQKMFLQELINESIRKELPMYEIIPSALAIYFQPIFDNSAFNDKRVEELKPMMSHTRISEAYPICAFFLKKYIQSFPGKRESLN